MAERTADVTVRGAGIFGLSIAWACVQRGARVQLVDPHGLAAGASGGIVGALAPHVPENWNPKKQFQLESLLMAEAFWAEVHAAGGRDPGYGRLGRIQPIGNAAALALAEARAVTARSLWGEAVRWSVVNESPWVVAGNDGHFIYDTLSARIHPRQACAALFAALNTQGVQLVPEASPAGKTIWATGTAGLGAIENRRPVGAGVKGQAVLFDLDARELPQLFVDALHVIPHADGTTAVGSTSEREYTHPTRTDAQLDDLVARVRALVPALQDAPEIGRWAGVRPRARSRAPMLGAWPERPGHYIANGGFKIGFGMAPKIADVVADLVLEGRDMVPEGFEVAASF